MTAFLPPFAGFSYPAHAWLRSWVLALELDRGLSGGPAKGLCLVPCSSQDLAIDVRSRVRQLIMTGRVSEAGQSAVSDWALHLPACVSPCWLLSAVLLLARSLL